MQAQFETSGSDDTLSSFFIRRVWVTIDGRLNDWISGRAQYDINGDRKALEAYLALNASDNVQFQLGQFKRAISTFWLAANFDLPLIDRDGRVPDGPSCRDSATSVPLVSSPGDLAWTAMNPHPPQRPLLRPRQPPGDAHQRRGHQWEGQELGQVDLREADSRVGCEQPLPCLHGPGRDRGPARRNKVCAGLRTGIRAGRLAGRPASAGQWCAGAKRRTEASALDHTDQANFMAFQGMAL